MFRSIVFGILLFGFSSAFGQQSTQEGILNPEIKTVLLYPFAGSITAPARTLLPPVKQLNDRQPLILEFDDLATSYNQYHVKIKHCTADWRLSPLNDIEYLDDFNDFIVNDYEVSQNTKLPYYHYRFRLPEVKVSGNYVLLVTKDDARNEPMIIKRFMVYEPLTSARVDVRKPQDPEYWRTHQQIDFEIDYRNYSVRSAKQDFRIVLRQNYRWSQTVTDLVAMSENAATGKLLFRFFDNENLMPAGNEFAFFDGRSTYTRGMGVAAVEQGRIDNFWLTPQVKGSRLNYVEQRDYDGQFVIENRENQDPSFSNDYVWVHFAAKSEVLLDKEVYVVGEFNQWQLDNNNQLIYNEADGLYEGQLLMKLGIYDYRFVVKDVFTDAVDDTYFSGNFSDTENVYELFIYHQPPTARAERLIGYQVGSSRVSGR